MQGLIFRLKHEFPIRREPVEEHPQRAAVLAIIFHKNGSSHVLLIKRSYKLRIHAGEISFPGGIFKWEDECLLNTALRETREELNLRLDESAVIAHLPVVNTLTGFEVTPFVALLDTLPEYQINENEVELVIEAPLAGLLATQQPDTGYDKSLDMTVFWHKHHRIWGATARILKTIGSLCAY